MIKEVVSREEAKARGLSQFFTGKPCGKGHMVGRYVASGSCAECERARKFDMNATHRNPADTRKAPVTRRQDELCAEIEAHGMTHREFCERLGWHPLTISRWRTRAAGNRTPWVDEVVMAWKELGYSLQPEPIENFSIDPTAQGKYPKAPLNCSPLVARMFFEQEQLGWSRKRLAEVSGVSENTLGRMASGESRGKFEQIEACFNAMGLALKPKPYSKALYQSRRKQSRGAVCEAKEVRNQMHGTSR